MRFPFGPSSKMRRTLTACIASTMTTTTTTTMTTAWSPVLLSSSISSSSSSSSSSFRKLAFSSFLARRGSSVSSNVLNNNNNKRDRSFPITTLFSAPSLSSSSPSPSSENGSTTTTRSSSTFVAPTPPESSGIAVFPDIDLELLSSSSNRPHATLRNSDPNAVFVVNGASRGIGLQFVKHLMKTTKGTIVACCRSPDDPSSGLYQYMSSSDDDDDDDGVTLQHKKDRIQIVPLDLEDQTSIESAGSTIRDKFDRVDLLLNVAGILGDSTTTPGPERSVTKLERDWMEKTFQVNVIGPVMFSKELVPLLGQRRRQRRPNQPGGDDGVDDLGERPHAVIANLSARVGSISDNGLGGWYSYRMSKSALNQATRTLSNELKRQSVWCIALHPGTTDTDLSKPFQKNVQQGRLFPVEFTVDQLKQVIDAMDDDNSGGLYDWAGKAIPF